MDLASAAIDELHPAKHSFRLLGAWRDLREKEWTEVARYEHLDIAAVYGELRSCGARVRRFKSRDARGLVWRANSKEAADVLLSSCPTLAKENSSSSFWPKSDTTEGAPPHPPVCEAEGSYDPESNPFR